MLIDQGVSRRHKQDAVMTLTSIRETVSVKVSEVLVILWKTSCRILYIDSVTLFQERLSKPENMHISATGMR